MEFTRRQVLASGAGAFAGFALKNRFDVLFAQEPRPLPRSAMSMIVLWMDGGPSQIDTFDPRPDRPTGGEFKAIPTSAKAIRFSELLPNTARYANHMSILRAVSSKEQDHNRGNYLLHTGYRQSGMVVHPSLGSIVSCEKGGTAGTPGYVSIKSSVSLLPGRELGPGFLGPAHAPYVIPDPLRPDRTLKALDDSVRERLRLLGDLNREFRSAHSGENIDKRKTFMGLARRLKDSPFAKALDLRDESPETLRAYLGTNEGEATSRYGVAAPNTGFGYGCLVARRLVESGVRFVEVNLGGWDTHANNFDQTANLCRILDPAMGALYGDLRRRGLLESTVIVWMGEFGRTPKINGNKGRDHWPNGFTVVVGGGGVKGGRIIGELDPDGMEIKKGEIRVQDLFATLCVLMGIDPAKRFQSHTTGLVRLTDHGVPVRDVYR